MIKKVHSHHLFMWSYLFDLLRALFRPAMVFLFFISVSIVFMSSVGFYYLEYGTNQKIQSLLDASYYIVTIFTGVGLGDIVPVTDSGRLLSMAVMFVGTAIYVSYAGVVTATILSLEPERH